jgi:hypothetical protein
MEEKKSYTPKELADEYNVCLRTFFTWISPIRKEVMAMNPNHKKRSRVFIPKQVKRIREYLG